MKPNIKLVKAIPVLAPTPKPKPYDEARGLVRMNRLRSSLLISAVRYVVEGNTGTKKDRVRKASDQTGIPTNLIEVALGK